MRLDPDHEELGAIIDEAMGARLSHDRGADEVEWPVNRSVDEALRALDAIESGLIDDEMELTAAEMHAALDDLRRALVAARLSHDRGADALPPDIEALADLFMDLRLDGPAQEGWTNQQTARHYARIIQRALSVPAPTLPARYELWDRDSGNIIGTYDLLDDVIQAAVRLGKANPGDRLDAGDILVIPATVMPGRVDALFEQALIGLPWGDDEKRRWLREVREALRDAV